MHINICSNYEILWKHFDPKFKIVKKYLFSWIVIKKLKIFEAENFNKGLITFLFSLFWSFFHPRTFTPLKLNRVFPELKPQPHYSWYLVRNVFNHRGIFGWLCGVKYILPPIINQKYLFFLNRNFEPFWPFWWKKPSNFEFFSFCFSA